MTIKRTNFEPLRVSVPVTFKEIQRGNQGEIEGYASTFGNIDLGGDVIERGAFLKTIKERVAKGMVPLLDSHTYNSQSVIGTVTEAVEDEVGLRFRAVISSAPSAQEIRTKMLEGHIKKLSIGFDTVAESFGQADDGNIIRYIKEAKLYEISVVPLPMNEATEITSVKSAVNFQDLDLALRSRAWDPDAAIQRVKEWATSGDSLNFAKYRRAFVWFDREDPENQSGYKFPIADVVAGALTVVPRAVFSAASVLCGARGAGIPDSDVPAVQRHLDKYYAKMREANKDDAIIAPWHKSIDIMHARILAGETVEVSSVKSALEAILNALPREQAEELRAELTAGPGIDPPTAKSSPLQLKARAIEIDAWLSQKRRAS